MQCVVINVLSANKGGGGKVGVMYAEECGLDMDYTKLFYKIKSFF